MLLSGAVDKRGRPVIVARACNHDPNCDFIEILSVLVYEKKKQTTTKTKTSVLPHLALFIIDTSSRKLCATLAATKWCSSTTWTTLRRQTPIIVAWSSSWRSFRTTSRVALVSPMWWTRPSSTASSGNSWSHGCREIFCHVWQCCHRTMDCSTTLQSRICPRNSAVHINLTWIRWEFNI